MDRGRGRGSTPASTTASYYTPTHYYTFECSDKHHPTTTTTITTATMKPSPSVALLLTNLRLLDYDFNAFSITPDVFTSLSARGKAFEHIIHHLFYAFDPADCELVSLATAIFGTWLTRLWGVRNSRVFGLSTNRCSPAN